MSDELRAVLAHPSGARLRPLAERCRRFLPLLRHLAASARRLAARAERLTARLRGLFPHFSITSRRGVILGAIGLVVVLAPSIPLTWSGMLNPLVGTQTEQSGLHTLVNPKQYPIKPSTYTNDVYLADYLNRLNLPEASVLMDTFIGWDVWLNSANRKKFVITSDFDFVQVLNAPQQFGIQYILVSDPDEDGQADAINQRYPTLYRTGAGFATLVMTVPATGDDATWRLYRVDGVPSVSASAASTG